jgi:putative membrane protein
MTRMRMAASALAMVFGAAGCASGGTMETGAGASGSMAGSGGMGVMTDANVAAVASASNMDEIETSRVALTRAQNAQVRAFAQQMISEHSAVEQRMQALLRSKGMAPQPNEPARAAMAATQETLRRLNGLSGAAFDQAYMAHQVDAHRWTLDSLDRSLIPAAHDDDLENMLKAEVRPAVAMHLQMAQQLRGTVGGSGTGSTQPR